jgi:hypothetical protein
MAHVTIEYMIMIPVLILQIFLFPLTTNWLMNVWVDSRRTLALQDAASNLGSTIQQLYFALNHPTIPVGTKISNAPGLPPFIDGFHYPGNATLQTISPVPGSAQTLNIALRLVATKITVTTSVILGFNARWNQASLFISNSTSTRVSAEKNETVIQLYFGG